MYLCVSAYLCLCAVPALSVLRGLPCAAHPLVCSARVRSFLSKKTECGGAGAREEGRSDRMRRTREREGEGEGGTERDRGRNGERGSDKWSR
jgi:hypothetical protein